MNPLDMIVDRSPAQDKLYVAKLRLELGALGYVIVSADWLRETLARLPVAKRMEAMADIRA